VAIEDRKTRASEPSFHVSAWISSMGLLIRTVEDLNPPGRFFSLHDHGNLDLNPSLGLHR